MKSAHLPRLIGAVAISLSTNALQPTARSSSELVFEDAFNRRINEHGVQLVDWEGQIANPAIQINILPPSDATFPASVVISSTQPRLYFDLPSAATASGPSKSFPVPNLSTRAPVFVSIYPDRDALDEDHLLTVKFTTANGAQWTQTLKVHVIDQDKGQAPLFTVPIDFSKDQTGFFNDAAQRNIVRQAADDWAYFFTDMNLDVVAAGAEETFIWNRDGFNSGAYVTNGVAYRGFLLYAYGIDAATPPYRSGGEPSFIGGFQSSGGNVLPLKRSGGVEIEIKGNFNTLGWYLTSGDDDWWKTGNLSDEQNDLYSIARHEIGHALIFNPSHTLFRNYKSAGAVNEPRVVAYHGSAPQVDAFDHLNGAIDRLSRKGAFGYEYFGSMPARRWTNTKLDLLVAQAIGYTLRPTSAFAALQISTESLTRGAVATDYAETIQSSGGIPFYKWSLSAGALPDGLTLDSFTGTIAGKPASVGVFAFTVELRDCDSATAPVTRAFAIRVEAAPFIITAIEQDNADILLSFTTVAGRSYQVEYKNDLPAAAWTLLRGDLNGTGSIVSVPDPGAAILPQRFYRAVEF